MYHSLKECCNKLVVRKCLSFRLTYCARSVVPRGGNLTYNGDPRVEKLTFENLKMLNFPWVDRTIKINNQLSKGNRT